MLPFHEGGFSVSSECGQFMNEYRYCCIKIPHMEM